MSDIPEPDQQLGSLLTVQGENYEQQGIVDDKQIQFLKIAIGDANDTYVEPDRMQTALVNELARFEINAVDVIQPNPDDVPVLRVQAFLPGDVNGIVIRELAAVASYDGGAEYLHAVGNCGRIFVPVPDNNGGVTTPISIEMSFIITSAEPIIILNPSISIASREWVTDNFVDFDTEQTISSKKIFNQDGSQAFGTPTVPDKFGIATLGEAWNLTTKDVGNTISVDENGNPSLYHDGVKTFETYGTGVLARSPSGLSAKIGVVNKDGSALLGVASLGDGYLAVGSITGAYAHRVVGWDSNGATDIHHDGTKVLSTTPTGIALGQTTFDNGGNIRYKNIKHFECFSAGASVLYHNGVKQFETGVNSVALYGQSFFKDADGTMAGYIHPISSGVQKGFNLVPGTGFTGRLFGTWTGTVTPSDSALNTNLKPLNGLAKLLQLETFSWDWVDHEKYKDYPNEGFTAQSYQLVFPDSVEAFELEIPDELKPETCKAPKAPKSDSEVTILGIKKDITCMTMDAYIVDAIKEIAAKNTELEARIKALEGQSD